MSDDKDNWRSVVDAASGRTYWYHRRTRETTWLKPSCLEEKHESSVTKPSIYGIDSSNELVTTVPYEVQNGKNSIDKQSLGSDIMQERTPATLLDSQIRHVAGKSHDNADYRKLDIIVQALTYDNEDHRRSGLDMLDKFLTDIYAIETIFNIYPKFVRIIANCVIQLKSERHKTLGCKLLWFFSLSPSADDEKAFSDISWDMMRNVVMMVDSDECRLYYAAFLSVMQIHQPQYCKIFGVGYEEKLVVWLLSILQNYDSKFLSSEKLHLQQKSNSTLTSIFDGAAILCLADITFTGCVTSGLLLNILFNYLLHSSERYEADEILLKYALPALCSMLTGFSTPTSVRESAKCCMREAMNMSPVIRMKLLNMFIDLSCSIDALGHPSKLKDPRLSFLATKSTEKDDAKSKIRNFLVEDSQDPPILRDIEWKPQNQEPWRLCSSIMWIRCPGMRGIIDEFWDAGGGGLQLSIDASSETLNSVCRYIHTGVLISPLRYLHKLELIKVAVELEMVTLANLAIENVIQNLTAEYVTITKQFSEALDLCELSETCQKFLSDGNISENRYNLDICTNTHRRSVFSGYGSNDVDLRNAIEESINEISNIEDSFSTVSEKNSLKDIGSHGTKRGVTQSNGNYTKINQAVQPKKSKSGGIYGLLLNNLDGSNDKSMNKVSEEVPSARKSQKSVSSVPGRDLPSTNAQKSSTNKSKLSLINQGMVKGKDMKGIGFGILKHQENENIDTCLEYDSVNMALTSQNTESRFFERQSTLKRDKKEPEENVGTNGTSLNSATVTSTSLETNVKEGFGNTGRLVERNKDDNSVLSVRSSLQLLKNKTKRRHPVEVLNVSEVDPSDLKLSVESSSNDIFISTKQDRILAIEDSTVLVSNTQECKDCGRCFNTESFGKHEKICAQVFSRKRKPFDSKKQRIIPDANNVVKAMTATSSNHASATSNKDVPKWKAESEAFRRSVKATKSNQTENIGVPYIDKSLMECPHCNRRFNQKAAERHIPICSSIKAKPTLLRKGSGAIASGTSRSGGK